MGTTGLSGYLALALPLYILGQAAIFLDFGSRLYACLARRVPKLLLAPIGLILSLLFWGPWILAVSSPAVASRAQFWVWLIGGVGAAWFVLYLLAPTPGVSKRPASVRRVSLERVPLPEAFLDKRRGRSLEIRRDRLDAPVSKLVSPFRLGVISDLHVRDDSDVRFLSWCLERLADLEPEAVFVIGDLTWCAPMFRPIAQTLGEAHTPFGVFASLGNHDINAGPRHAERAFDETSARLVRPGDGELTIRPGVTLAATEAPFAGRPPKRGIPGDEQGRPYRILLSHTPGNFRAAARAGYDLVLAGHTHGGYPDVPGVGPLIVPLASGRAMAEGWFRRGRTHLLVTRGVGGIRFAPFPPRPQIASIDLVPQPDRSASP